MIEFKKPRISVKQISETEAKFTIEPLERGFGYTLGNSLRRALLSSLPGAAVTSIKIDGVSHEFSTVKGVREDVTDIVLNIKDLVLKLHGDEPAKLCLKVKGPKEVKASDIQCPAEVEIINPKLHIATLNEKGKLNMEMMVEFGRGYVSAERNKKASAAVGVIPIDSLFTPVAQVSYVVENTRVGQRTDFDKLILEVHTNGGLTPMEAVAKAAKIVNDHMELFMKQVEEEMEETVFVPEEEERDKILDMPIEDLELSVRAYNCLKRQGIDTLEQLIDCTEADLMNIRNFGAKSIEEVKGKLADLELALKPG